MKKTFITLTFLTVAIIPCFSQMDDQWFDGTIKFKDGNIVDCSINLYNYENDDILIRHNNKQSRIHTKNYIWVELNDTIQNEKRRFFVLPYINYGYTRYEVLVENEHITLLSKEIQRRHADYYSYSDPVTNTPVSGQKKSKLNNYSRFFLIIEGQDIIEFSDEKETHENKWAFKKVDLKKLNGIVDGEEIKNFINSENIDLSIKKDVTRLIEFCNGQIVINGY